MSTEDELRAALPVAAEIARQCSTPLPSRPPRVETRQTVTHHPVETCIQAIAQDIGRLKRTTPPDTSAWWALERLSHQIQLLAWMVLYPTAAELYTQYLAISGDHEVSVQEALREVDRLHRNLERILNPARLQAVREDAA